MLLVATAAASAATGFGPGLWDGFRGTLRSWEALGFDRQFGVGLDFSIYIHPGNPLSLGGSFPLDLGAMV